MIQFTILLPLAITGIASAIWREHRQQKLLNATVNLQPADNSALLLPPSSEVKQQKPTFDDCSEMDHYQHISLYSLALSIPASLFYAPVALICIPLLSYSSYNLCKTVQYSSQKTRRSAWTVFEFAFLAGSLLTGRFITASAALSLSFSMRKILLQAGNVAHMGFHEAMSKQATKVWVLRDDVEVESTISELTEQDIIIVQAGELIVVEGIVHDGSGIVRQFSLLNSIKSISKQKGNKVFPFTRLESGRLLLRKC